MTSYSIFLTLAFAMGFVSSRPNLFNGNPTAWDNPEFIAAYPSLYNQAIQGEVNYDPSLVINAMRKRTPHLKIITAHRGIHGPGCPENTICAVDATIAAGIESVEIDVRNDKDGTLWPIHDLRIGRVTNYSLPGQAPFDPYHDSANSPSNPMIADLSAPDFLYLRTRDNNQKICDDFVNLQTILQHIKANGHLAVMLDVKSKDAIASAADMIRNLGMTASAGIKFLDILLDPSNSTDMAILDGINFVPVQFAPTQDIIASTGSWFTSYYKRVTDYDGLFLSYKNILNFEPSCKMWEYWGPFGWLPRGPGAFVQDYLEWRITLGTFVPTPDVDQGYFSSDGTCCLQLSQFLAKTKYFGAETRDDRTNPEAMIMTHNIIIADDVTFVVEIANQYRYRDVKSLLGSS